MWKSRWNGDFADFAIFIQAWKFLIMRSWIYFAQFYQLKSYTVSSQDKFTIKWDRKWLKQTSLVFFLLEHRKVGGLEQPGICKRWPCQVKAAKICKVSAAKSSPRRSHLCPDIFPEVMRVSMGISIYPLVNVYITMENHHVVWENPLFLWPFSIAMLNYQRVLFPSNKKSYDFLLFPMDFVDDFGWFPAASWSLLVASGEEKLKESSTRASILDFEHLFVQSLGDVAVSPWNTRCHHFLTMRLKVLKGRRCFPGRWAVWSTAIPWKIWKGGTGWEWISIYQLFSCELTGYRGFGSPAQPGFSVRKHFLSAFFRVEKMEEIMKKSYHFLEGSKGGHTTVSSQLAPFGRVSEVFCGGYPFAPPSFLRLLGCLASATFGTGSGASLERGGLRGFTW